jgi:hypothetical protein
MNEPRPTTAMMQKVRENLRTGHGRDRMSTQNLEPNTPTARRCVLVVLTLFRPWRISFLRGIRTRRRRKSAATRGHSRIPQNTETWNSCVHTWQREATVSDDDQLPHVALVLFVSVSDQSIFASIDPQYHPPSGSLGSGSSAVRKEVGAPSANTRGRLQASTEATVATAAYACARRIGNDDCRPVETDHCRPCGRHKLHDRTP